MLSPYAPLQSNPHRRLKETPGDRVLLLVNERSFDISANAEEAANSADRGEHALLDITLDKSLLQNSNAVTVTIYTLFMSITNVSNAGYSLRG